MKKLLSALMVAALAASTTAASAAAPDFERAYVLATASYCAYAVSEEPNDAGVKDSGLERAARCLNRAASDSLLAELAVGPENVEAFVGPDPKDAYLLINGKKGIILAFRGTIVPPTNLDAKSPGGALLGAILDNPINAKDGLQTFVSDWLSNARVSVVDHQHKGFLASWNALRANLEASCQTPAAKQCSKLGLFLAKPASSEAPAIYVTGHSKGGALAALAIRNPPAALKNTPLTGYTFASAKALDSDGAKNASATEQAVWRFEKDGDVVPSLPVDSSIPLPSLILPTYAPVGHRVLFLQDESHAESAPTNGVDSPGDLKRISGTLVELSGDWMKDLFGGAADGAFTRLMLANEASCRRVVDRHFEVFSSLRKLARASAPHPTPGDDFFSTGFYDGDKQILWGYSRWCDLLKPHQ
ncbi:MAG: hypothetical protein WB816_12370 [Methylocystis sp.]